MPDFVEKYFKLGLLRYIATPEILLEEAEDDLLVVAVALVGLVEDVVFMI